MNNIPTAEEFYNQQVATRNYLEKDVVCTLLQRFAQLHVQAALQAASKVLDVDADGDYIKHPMVDDILSSYPLDNIK